MIPMPMAAEAAAANSLPTRIGLIVRSPQFTVWWRSV